MFPFKPSLSDPYWGMLKLCKNNYLFFTEQRYYDLTRILSLEEDTGLFTEYAGNPKRKRNYKAIRDHYEQKIKGKPDLLERYLHFHFYDEQAKEVVSDFLNKYAITFNEWYFNSNDTNIDYYKYPYGRHFMFVRHKPFQKDLAMAIDTDHVIRLCGTVEHWEIAFDYGFSYCVSKKEGIRIDTANSGGILKMVKSIRDSNYTFEDIFS